MQIPLRSICTGYLQRYVVYLSTLNFIKFRGGTTLRNKNKLKTLFLLMALTLILDGCIAGKYKPTANMAGLDISFADSIWTGKEIPKGQQCSRFGGNAETPKLVVKNIPAGTNALIMEYSDRSYQPMDNGGHGIIGYYISSGSQQVTIPSVPGHTFDLPKGFFLVSAHQGSTWDKAGAYMPPCSGGNGNLYVVKVKAVYDAPEGQESKLLGEGNLSLGRY
jgi:hypothetical protein